MDWRSKLPTADPNPPPADDGVSSPTTEEREQARPRIDTGQKRNPWLHDGNLKVKPVILKSDLILPPVQVNVDGDTLCLEPEDYVPVPVGWGHCLLGFMAGKFPGRDAIERLTLTWPWPSRVAFHPNGWMVFRFENEEDMEAAKSWGNHTVFGTPLMLCSMPDDFNFDQAPDFQFKVWASLPGLQLELWQPRTLAKIAKMVGTPVEVDHRTAARVNIDGPRIHVIVDAKTPPPEFIKIKLPSGKIISQKITFDFYPLFCSHCRRMGHSTAMCRQGGKSHPGPRDRSRGAALVGTEGGKADGDGWQRIWRKKNRNAREGTSAGAARGASRPPQQQGNRGASRPRQGNNGPRPRSVSRPPPGQATAHANHQQAQHPIANGMEQQGVENGRAWGDIPKEILNNHTYIVTPPPDVDSRLNQSDPVREAGLYSTQLEPMIEKGPYSTQPPHPTPRPLVPVTVMAGEGSEATEYVQTQLSPPKPITMGEVDGVETDGESTDYASDGQGSDTHSFVADSAQVESGAEDLNEPITVVGLNKGPLSQAESKSRNMEKNTNLNMRGSSPTALSESVRGPDKELAFVNKTRGNKGRGNQGSTVVRRSERHR